MEEKINKIVTTKLDDRSLQKILRELNYEELLKAAPYYDEDEIFKIAKNLSKNTRLQFIVEALISRNSYTVEMAKKYVNELEAIGKTLLEAGDIVLPEGAEEPVEKDYSFLEKNKIDNRSASGKEVKDRYLKSDWWPDDHGYSFDPDEKETVEAFTKKVAELPDLKIDPMPYIKMIISMSVLARRWGLLQLEDVIQDCNSKIFRDGLQLMCDGTAPELTRRILNEQKKRLLQEYSSLLDLIVDGVLSIQDGDNPRIVSELMQAHL